MSIKFEHTEVVGWEAAIRGMRNPMNSWEKSDSIRCYANANCPGICRDNAAGICIGENDLDLMKRLRNAGTDHRKFMRMIVVYVDITAPLYWWKEFDTYKVGTVANSCSTMHKIAAKEFTLEDFSTEHLDGRSLNTLEDNIDELNYWREVYFKAKAMDHPKPTAKDIWWYMIQLLPSSYNQKRTVMMNYEVLANIYKSRKNHKLDEWKEHPSKPREFPKTEKEFKERRREPLCTPEFVCDYFGFCDWITTLPYSELITGEESL